MESIKNFKHIAGVMFARLEEYEENVCTNLFEVAFILDSRFGNNLLADADIIRRYVDNQSNCFAFKAVFSKVINWSATESSDFMQKLFDEESLQGQ